MTDSEARSLNVLVVDDDPLALKRTSEIVATAGHQVSLAHDGTEACDLIQCEVPDLVICDWGMPELNGVELCRRIRSQPLPQYVYFILVTTNSGATKVVEGLAAGADDFIAKPVDPAELLARIGAGSRVVGMERRLRTSSQLDPLTGVLNRRAFHECAAREWDRATRHKFPLSVAMVDLDFFKRINDSHGHAAGDTTLTKIAALLEEQCRSSDIVCRYGGEEFCVLLPETNEAGAALWAERVRTAIATTTIATGDLVLQVTSSLGIAQRWDDTQHLDQLIEWADQSLAVAKRSGRNRVVRFSSLSEPLLHPGGAAIGPLDGVSAHDMMSVAIHCPSQDDTVRQVADVFLQLRLSSAPVVDDAGHVVGVVADNDLLTRTALGSGWDDRISDVMRTDVVCYDINTPAREVYQFLSRVSVPRIVVVENGRPAGVISRGTLLRWFRNWVTTHGKSPENATSYSDHEARQRRSGIIKTAEVTQQRAAFLRRSIEEDDHDFVPRVVGEATRLQSLANDLLGHCRTHSMP